MAAPYYHLPGASGFTLSLLETYGLADALSDITSPSQMAIAENVKGPGGHGLLICAWRPGQVRPPDMRYLPEEQEWQQLPGENSWIGWPKQSKPRPDDLLRFCGDRAEPMLCSPGLEERLADGQLWNIPVIRFPANEPVMVTGSKSEGSPWAGSGTHLPVLLGIDRQGQVTRRIRASDAKLWQQFERIANWIWNINNSEGFVDRYPSEAEQILAACAALGRNYRICPVVASALGLIDSETLVRMLAAACGLSIAQEVIAQKKTAEPHNSQAGLQDG